MKNIHMMSAFFAETESPMLILKKNNINLFSLGPNN